MVDPEWDANCREGGLSSGEGLISRLRDRTWKGDPAKPVIDDPGVTDKRLFLREEEFARVTTVMSRDKNTVSQILRNLWDTGDASVLTKGPHDRTTGAHVCLIGNITQSELRQALTDCDAKNGFANRFLWVCAKRSRSLPRGGNVDLPAAQPLICVLQETFGLIHAGHLRRALRGRRRVNGGHPCPLSCPSASSGTDLRAGRWLSRDQARSPSGGTRGLALLQGVRALHLR
jgi:hypothetical protein